MIEDVTSFDLSPGAVNYATREVYYRYTVTQYSGGADEWGDPIPGGLFTRKLHCEEYEVHHHTPCGVVISQWGTLKFINYSWTKQYAHATKEAALRSFHVRKDRQISVLRAQLKAAEYDQLMGYRLQDKARLAGVPL